MSEQRPAALSVEVAHVYLHSFDEEAAERTAQTAARWVGPVLDRYHERGHEVSTCILVDDYFDTGGGADPGEAARILREACAAVDLEIHHIVREGALSETVQHMLDGMAEAPREGAGSRGGVRGEPQPKENWLSNGDPMRIDRGDEGVETFQRAIPVPDEAESPEPRHQHALYLDVQLWSTPKGERRWACPTLAAWWQLIRLGVLQHTQIEHEVPTGTWSHESAPPLAAKRTLSVLQPRFLEIEHAVRTILSQYALGDAHQRALRDSSEEVLPNGHLDRIGYVFVSDAFDPHNLRTS